MLEDEFLPSWADPVLTTQLQLLCNKGEGSTLEFKRQMPAQVRDIAKSLAGFASCSGGQILIGVEDNGNICGIADGHNFKTRDDFAQRIGGLAREVKPPVHVTVLWATYLEKVVASVVVEKGLEPIYYSDFKPYVRRGNISRPAEPGEVEEAFRNRCIANEEPKSVPTTRKISKRLKLVLALFNQNNSNSLTVSDLAQAIGVASPTELDSVFEGHTHPTFALIDRFAARFAMNKEWLLTGRSTPFASTVPYQSSPELYQDYIEKSDPEVIYLIRSTSTVGECCIVLQKDEMTAWLLPQVWHVSDHVGAGGASDLVSLYHLFKRWIDRDDHNFVVLGRQIDPKEMKNLYEGKIFPGVVGSRPRSHWWDDLTDLEHKWANREQCAKAYGKGFVAAQDIIRKLLENSKLP